MKLTRRDALRSGVALLSSLAFPGALRAQGKPLRIGSTLPLTGPLASLALIHKVTGEIYVEELNKRGGLLGRPVEWVLRDDQSKPELTRTLYEQLITSDQVDLIIGPYATASILSAMGVAQRYNKLLLHHSFGIPNLAKYDMQFQTAGVAADPENVWPNLVLRRGRGLAQAAEDGRHRGEQVPVGALHLRRRPGSAEEARPHRGALHRVRVRHPRLRRDRRPREGRESGSSSGAAPTASTRSSCSRR